MRMATGGERVVVVVRPGVRTPTVLAWLRQLLPAAMLLVAPASLPPDEAGESDAIVVEADDFDSPMSLADAVARSLAEAGHR
ncbi:MAG TPA: hypothetical protein VLS93_13875 [Anaeromyxobacteraceae bacterium]|nr:hypothetical protein [Anaeromyxobacteraceae bacterium]